MNATVSQAERQAVANICVGYDIGSATEQFIQAIKSQPLTLEDCRSLCEAIHAKMCSSEFGDGFDYLHINFEMMADECTKAIKMQEYVSEDAFEEAMAKKVLS